MLLLYLTIIYLAAFYIPNIHCIDFDTQIIEKSCLNARVVYDSSAGTCPYVNWLSAQLFVSGNFSYYSPGSPLSETDQRSYASYIYEKLSDKVSGSLTSQCSQALRRLACVTAFPSCPDAGTTLSSISYFKPCRLQCSQAEALCTGQVSLDCEQYPSSSCDLYVDASYFVLPPEQGPYGAIQVIYVVVFVCWLVMAALWNYWIMYPYKDTALPICRAVSFIPVIKVVVLIFGIAFWTTCVEWKLCSFWLGIALVNAQLIYEAAAVGSPIAICEMIILILVSKGWSVTTQYLDPIEWRNIIMLIASFYIANSIIIVLQTSTLSPSGFLIAVGILYGVMYLYILYNTNINYQALTRMAGMFNPTMPQDIIGPSFARYRMYVYFLLLVLISISMEFLSHGILFSGGPMWIVLLIYEVSNLSLFFVIGYMFRPRVHSPYFFMVPVRLTDERMRSIPIIEAHEEAENAAASYGVELTSLLNRAQDDVNIPRKLIMIKNPDTSLAVGVA